MIFGRYIRLVVLTITLAMVGLIAVQIYWIDNAITLRTGEFRENVNTALHQTVESLQRNEALGYIRNTAVGSRLLSGMDSRRMISSRLGSMTSRDTTVIQDGKEVRMQVLEKQTTDSSLGIRTEERVIGSVIRNGIDEKTGEASLNLVFDDSIRLFFRPGMMSDHMQVGKKAQMVEEILSEMFSFRGFMPTEVRVNIRELDSLLKVSLHDLGIHTSYRFVLTDIGHKVLMASDSVTPEMYPSILDAGYSINLFPGDFFNDPIFLFIEFPSQQSYLLGRMWSILSISAVLVMIIILAFFITISTILKQKKLSEIKNDFISNMTHELKTPISTIALASEMLSDQDIQLEAARKNDFIRMIREENKRLGILVENVLQTAVIDRGELQLKFENVDMNELIRDVAGNFSLQVNQRGGKLDTSLPIRRCLVKGDRVHLRHVLYNLLDNANKYSPESPEIKIEAETDSHSLRIRVSDKGIGIGKDDQKRIFEHLYRVPSGNIHNVKGFGLGLSYVKAVVEKHNGTVTVSSESGKGSTFTIEIPCTHE
jgi:two-component system, OmpR family, phosphate regulon sensor histidine kinase PhoR